MWKPMEPSPVDGRVLLGCWAWREGRPPPSGQAEVRWWCQDHLVLGLNLVMCQGLCLGTCGTSQRPEAVSPERPPDLPTHFHRVTVFSSFKSWLLFKILAF